MTTNDIMNQIPESIMKHHDPNDDPFASLSDDSSNQLQSPLEFGSGISYFVNNNNSGKDGGDVDGGEDKEDGKNGDSATKEEPVASTDEAAASSSKATATSEEQVDESEEKKDEA